jgi:hypothetical protein
MPSTNLRSDSSQHRRHGGEYYGTRIRPSAGRQHTERSLRSPRPVRRQTSADAGNALWLLSFVQRSSGGSSPPATPITRERSAKTRVVQSVALPWRCLATNWLVGNGRSFGGSSTRKSVGAPPRVLVSRVRRTWPCRSVQTSLELWMAPSEPRLGCCPSGWLRDDAG